MHWSRHKFSALAPSMQTCSIFSQHWGHKKRIHATRKWRGSLAFYSYILKQKSVVVLDSEAPPPAVLYTELEFICDSSRRERVVVAYLEAR
jgi:hypothetical protein